jgi:hypothetical protein
MGAETMCSKENQESCLERKRAALEAVSTLCKQRTCKADLNTIQDQIQGKRDGDGDGGGDKDQEFAECQELILFIRIF